MSDACEGKQEMGYYQRKRIEEHKERVAQQQKREKRTIDKLIRQVSVYDVCVCVCVCL